MTHLPFKHLSMAAILAIIEQSRRENPEPAPDSPKSELIIWDAGLDDDDIPPRMASPLFRMVMALSFDAIHELDALMWTGRGDGEPASFHALVQYSREHPDNKQDAAAYITDKIDLDEYLEQGLRKLTEYYGSAKKAK
jgi:hypothetical protein